jgi:hypothetical protein
MINYGIVRIATSYGLDDRGVGIPSPGSVKNFLFSSSSRPALGSTQPPIQWVPGALSRGWNGRGVKLTTHVHLVRCKENVDLFIHSPTSNGIVLYYLSIGDYFAFLSGLFSLSVHLSQEQFIKQANK